VIDRLDKKLLNELQKGLPVTPRPFRAIAQKAGFSEAEILQRLKRFKKKGIIRTIQASFDYRKLGYKSTLIGMRLPKLRLAKLTKQINSYNGVTHSYIRDHKYNLWFTLIAKSNKEMQEIIRKIKKTASVHEDELLNLPAVNTFKLEVIFDLK